MPYQNVLNQMLEHSIISDDLANKIEIEQKNKPFSLHWELRTLLYLGISLFIAGIGILIYKNINTIGHDVLIAIIGIACIACFYYAFKHAKPFIWDEQLDDTAKLTDFALLGACLLFLALETYLQYQYNLFGNKYGIATLLPAILFFFCAYRFDHRGVLSMGITALASCIGISISPLTLWQSGKLNTETLIYSAILLGIFLVLLGLFSEKKALKKHFTYSYLFYGCNMVFIAALTGLFNYDNKIIFFMITAALVAFSIYYGRKSHSYLFLLMGVIFGYMAVTYVFFKSIPQNFDFFTYLFYFFASAGGIIAFLVNIKKILKSEL
jgi:hypothetical protein